MNNILEYLENTNITLPDKVAFISGEKSISFSELRKKSALCGKHISELANGVQGKPICVIAERDIDALICMFGCLYSGNYYVLIDSALPTSRINSMITAVNFLGTVSCNGQLYDNSDLLFSGAYEQSWLEECTSDTELDKYVNGIINQNKSFDPLYGIFTSGSTGIPKLVVKSHASMINFIEIFVSLFGFEESDVLGNQFPFYFDASTKDIFCCLKCGITTHIIPKECFSFPKSLVQYLIDYGVTKIIWVPSALSLVANADAFNTGGIPIALKKVFFVGEQMPVRQLNYWKKKLPLTEFINIYGSTEVAGNFLYFIYEDLLNESDRLPTGKPFPNTKVFLLSEEQNEITGTGREGEICVVSDTLSLGYFGDAERTNTVFVQNPLVPYREVMYRTGDLAVYDEEHNIVWKSRKDFQIKHMGYRIELSEIEIIIGAIEGIHECCCIYDFDNKKILLYYQSSKDMKLEIGRIVRNSLPKYMYPAKYIRLSELPHNKNGKIDRSELMNRTHVSV